MGKIMAALFGGSIGILLTSFGIDLMVEPLKFLGILIPACMLFNLLLIIAEK